MLLYRDAVSSDEMLSDGYKIEEVKDLPSVIRVKVQMIDVETGINESAFAFNASAEGEDADAGADDQSKKVIDIVEAFELKPFDMFHDMQGTAAQQNKAFIKDYFKKYLKLVKEKQSECCATPADFQKNVTAFMAFVKENWSNIALYTGKGSEDTVVDGTCSCSFLTYGDSGLPEYMYYCKHFLTEEKS